MTAPHRQIASNIHQLVHGSIEQHKQSHTAIVTDITPLEIELVGRNMTLSEDHGLVLSQWVRQYDYEHGIETKDSVMVDYRDGIWIVTDVLNDKVATNGLSVTDIDGLNTRLTALEARVAVLEARPYP